jgi:IS1 family transposase
MNVLSNEKKELILTHLVEGLSIRSIERITGITKRAIIRVLCEYGEKASEILDSELVNLKCNFVQMDEIWGYVGKKQKGCTEEEKRIGRVGDQYVFVAMDSDTKLVIASLVGKRTLENATTIIKDLQFRVSNRFQLSTDAFVAYNEAVDRVFGEDIDYGQVHKNYAEEFRGEKRYSPAKIVSTSLRIILGDPQKKRISTSHIERQNLTMRMNMRRLTRLTNAFSKKLENHKAAIALHFFHYNFMRIHSSLRVTPAMQAKITNRLWNWNDLLSYNNIARKAA